MGGCDDDEDHGETGVSFFSTSDQTGPWGADRTASHGRTGKWFPGPQHSRFQRRCLLLHQPVRWPPQINPHKSVLKSLVYFLGFEFLRNSNFKRLCSYVPEIILMKLKLGSYSQVLFEICWQCHYPFPPSNNPVIVHCKHIFSFPLLPQERQQTHWWHYDTARAMALWQLV